MQQRSRGPPAPFPVAGQVAGSHIAIASAACSPAGPETDPPFSCQRWRHSTQFQHQGNTMLVKNANFDRDDPLHEINRLFEASDRAGQVLWQPRVDNGDAVPHAMIFFQEHCRLAVTFVTPICAVDGRNWKEMDSAGGVAMTNPIKQAWRAAEEVRKTIKNALGTGAYVIPVVVFVNMAENADITAARGRSQVKLVWEIQDLVERFAALPEEHQVQPQLNTDLIEDETLALGWAPEASPTAKAPAAKTPTDLSDLDLTNRPVFFQHADTVHITINLPPGYGTSQPPQE